MFLTNGRSLADVKQTATSPRGLMALTSGGFLLCLVMVALLKFALGALTLILIVTAVVALLSLAGGFVTKNPLAFMAALVFGVVFVAALVVKWIGSVALTIAHVGEWVFGLGLLAALAYAAWSWWQSRSA